MALTRVQPGIADTFSAGKNAVMNGAFEVWQRGTSFAAIATAAYHADRWAHNVVGAAVHTVSRSTDVPTISEAGILANYSLLVDCTTVDAAIAAGDYTFVTHKIEGYVWRGFAQRALTLSFWVKATKTGTYCISLRNSGVDRTYVAEYTVGTTATWEKKTINILASPSAGTWDYTTGSGIILGFTIASGTTFHTTAGAWQTGNLLATANQVNGTDNTANDFRLALVQLEIGDSATDFEHVPFYAELQRCLRYYEKSFPYTTAPVQNVNNTTGAHYSVQGVGASTATISSKESYKVPKRAAVTPTFYNNNAANTLVRNIGAGADTSANSTHHAGIDSFALNYTSAVGSGAGSLNVVHWTVNADL